MRKTAIIIGAGPAGLTAALELLRRTDIQPIVLEATHDIGGISRTIKYKGNRMDIGGHRFFSKSDRVMQWWMDMMPIGAENAEEESIEISYQGKRHSVNTQPVAKEAAFSTRADFGARNGNGLAAKHAEAGAVAVAVAVEEDVATDVTTDSEAPASDPDRIMLIRPRKSRIYYLRKFFDYPITLTAQTLQNLGAIRTARVGTSYILSRFRQITPERSLEHFLINRFGRELYLTFFKSYTEKVWGTPCDKISAEWGAQRIKGLSLMSAIKHFIKKLTNRAAPTKDVDVAQKGTDTSLIERFMYPKLGPGQLWEYAAAETLKLGGEMRMGRKVVGLQCVGKSVRGVEVMDDAGHRETFHADYVFSTMPMKDLVRAMDADKPAHISEISEGLQYRDFITVGLLVDRLAVTEANGGLLKDTWIYIQEPDVLLGRLQIFNNWSPHLVSDPTKVWIGLEYFCYEGDDLWKMDDAALQAFAVAEVASIGILKATDVCDGHVVRVPKTYPAYFGTYERFSELRDWVNEYENLFLIGRNGMHKYNNQDHSMLTAMAVVDGLCAGSVDKAALWNINTEQDYQEEKHGK